MTPEEFVAAIVAIKCYMEREKPLEIKEAPKIWKIVSRVKK
ncbi:MAG: hypothetical protein QFX40_02190 [Archaeoglobales archaeon]|nr:hypothetical protein [Archaeoglobales archaeon]